MSPVGPLCLQDPICKTLHLGPTLDPNGLGLITLTSDNYKDGSYDTPYHCMVNLKIKEFLFILATLPKPTFIFS